MGHAIRMTAHVMAILLLATVSPTLAEEAANRRTPAEQRIDKALEEYVDFDFVDLPLCDVVRAIGESHRINIRLDRHAIAEQTVDENAPVTFRVGGITLRSALRHLLTTLDLDFVVRQETLMITDHQGAERFQVVRVHQVGNLVGPYHTLHMPNWPNDSWCTGRTESNRAPDFDSLIETITSIVDPDTWPGVAGAASIKPLGSDLIVVRHRRDMQVKLQRRLRWLGFEWSGY